MKFSAIIALASTLGVSSLSAQSDTPYLNWVRQIQIEVDENGNSVEIVRDNYVDSRGEDESLLGIPEQGALFQLWTIKSDTGETWLLDTATVGSYLPSAEIIIDAEDSYAGEPRTRADRPFSVTYQYGGLENDDSLPLAARQVLLVQQAENSEALENGGGSDDSIGTGNSGNTNNNGNSGNSGNGNSNHNRNHHHNRNAATEAANAATNAGITLANDAHNTAVEAANAATNAGITLANDAHNTAVEAANAARNASNNSANFNNPDASNSSSNSHNFGGLDDVTDTLSSAVELVYQEVKNADGEEMRNYASTNITSADPADALKVRGVEKFAVESFSENEDFRYLDQAELQVYPVPSGEIVGLVDGQRYRTVPTVVSYEVENAYPGSEIYLEVVEMSSDNTEIEETLVTVQDTHRNVPNDQDYDYSLEVEKYADYVSVASKTFRTRLVSKSIFGTEILSESTNFFNNDIAVRGGVYTLD